MKEKWIFLLVLFPVLAIADLRFPLMTVQIESNDVKSRESISPGFIDIDSAAIIAIDALLESRDDMETPLFVAKKVLCQRYMSACGITIDDFTIAKNFLLAELNKLETTLKLMPLTDNEGRVYSPQFWIFSLQIPSISEHLYYAIIDREGLITPHVYGIH